MDTSTKVVIALGAAGFLTLVGIGLYEHHAHAAGGKPAPQPNPKGLKIRAPFPTTHGIVEGAVADGKTPGGQGGQGSVSSGWNSLGLSTWPQCSPWTYEGEVVKYVLVCQGTLYFDPDSIVKMRGLLRQLRQPTQGTDGQTREAAGLSEFTWPPGGMFAKLQLAGNEIDPNSWIDSQVASGRTVVATINAVSCMLNLCAANGLAESALGIKFLALDPDSSVFKTLTSQQGPYERRISNNQIADIGACAVVASPEANIQ